MPMPTAPNCWRQIEPVIEARDVSTDGAPPPPSSARQSAFVTSNQNVRRTRRTSRRIRESPEERRVPQVLGGRQPSPMTQRQRELCEVREQSRSAGSRHDEKDDAGAMSTVIRWFPNERRVHGEHHGEAAARPVEVPTRAALQHETHQQQVQRVRPPR